MKKRNKALEYLTIFGVVFVAFVFLLSSGKGSSNQKDYVDIGKLQISNIFKPKTKIDLTVEEEHEIHYSIDVKDEGYDIYSPNRSGYRYGPSIVYYDDGSMDAWFSANGNNSSEWDWISYRHYDGENWGEEEIVLRPTRGSSDHYSTCDPGVIYFNGYYYLGYTSTENATNGGVENCAYVARSKNPNGPYEKWNGSSWGGNPSPIIVYGDADQQWGAGELSFVIVDDRLFCYYTWINSEGCYTRLKKADLVDDWPLTLKEKGFVIYKENGQDSCDVIYVDEYDVFLAFCVESRFTKDSGIAVYESLDGKNFTQVDLITDNIQGYAHNMGISKKLDGHVSSKDDLVIGYGYGRAWGRWSLKIHDVKIKEIEN